MVFEYARIPQAQARKPFCKMPHAQIGAFDKRRIDSVRPWRTGLDANPDAGALCWTVTPCSFARGVKWHGVEFLHSGEVHAAQQMFTNHGLIRSERIGCYLNPAINSLGNVFNEGVRVFDVSLAGVITDDEFFAGGNGQKRVLIAAFKIVALAVRQLL